MNSGTRATNQNEIRHLDPPIRRRDSYTFTHYSTSGLSRANLGGTSVFLDEDGGYKGRGEGEREIEAQEAVGSMPWQRLPKCSLRSPCILHRLCNESEMFLRPFFPRGRRKRGRRRRIRRKTRVRPFSLALSRCSTLSDSKPSWPKRVPIGVGDMRSFKHWCWHELGWWASRWCCFSSR